LEGRGGGALYRGEKSLLHATLFPRGRREKGGKPLPRAATAVLFFARGRGEKRAGADVRAGREGKRGGRGSHAFAQKGESWDSGRKPRFVSLSKEKGERERKRFHPPKEKKKKKKKKKKKPPKKTPKKNPPPRAEKGNLSALTV